MGNRCQSVHLFRGERKSSLSLRWYCIRATQWARCKSNTCPENAFTSAVGTALGKAAIGLPANGMASFDEVQSAISRQEKAQKDFELEKKNLVKRYADMTWDQYESNLSKHYDFTDEMIDTLRTLWIGMDTVDNVLEPENKLAS